MIVADGSAVLEVLLTQHARSTPSGRAASCPWGDPSRPSPHRPWGRTGLAPLRCGGGARPSTRPAGAGGSAGPSAEPLSARRAPPPHLGVLGRRHRLGCGVRRPRGGVGRPTGHPGRQPRGGRATFRAHRADLNNEPVTHSFGASNPPGPDPRPWPGPRAPLRGTTLDQTRKALRDIPQGLHFLKPGWCARADLNCRPFAPQANALSGLS